MGREDELFDKYMLIRQMTEAVRNKNMAANGPLGDTTRGRGRVLAPVSYTHLSASAEKWSSNASKTTASSKKRSLMRCGSVCTLAICQLHPKRKSVNRGVSRALESG